MSNPTSHLWWPCCFLFLLPFYCFAQQICDGNLGANIFTEGDFGTGTANIPPMNPGIAPGYVYTTSPPPPDGFYAITNNTNVWGALYPSWLRIRDNSDDPNGYMMVVNASFEPGLFYQQTIDGLCENTLYEFSADIINMIMTTVPNHILPNVSFLLDGEVVYSTGSIPQNESWITYGFTFTTEPGVTSLELSLRNNAPGGIGNDLALDNISFRACGPTALILPETIANICEDGDPITITATIIGDQYANPAIQWQESLDQGQTWIDINGENDFDFTHTELASGFYYYRYLLANSDVNLDNTKCRVISNVKVIHVVPKFWTVNDTICNGLTYFTGNSAYTISGTYIDSLISSIGCDSIVTLNLTVIPDPGIVAETTVTDPACAGEATGSISIDAINNGTASYDIMLGDIPNPAPGFFPDLSAGTYPLIIRDRFGCSFETELVITDPPPFIIDLGPDLTIKLGEEIDITAATTLPITSFNWTPESGIICPDDCLGLQGFPIESNNYVLDAFSEDGCQAVDSIFIEVIADYRVYIPNAFSPNNDGINDYFTVYGESPLIQQVKKLMIFNRWGSVIYEIEDLMPNQPELGWDGTFNGQELGSDVFVWVVEVVFLDQQERRFSGDVLLVK